MIHFILTFVMGIAVGALLLIRSYAKDQKSTPRLRCPDVMKETTEAEADTVSDESTLAVEQADAQRVSPLSSAPTNFVAATPAEADQTSLDEAQTAAQLAHAHTAAASDYSSTGNMSAEDAGSGVSSAGQQPTLDHAEPTVEPSLHIHQFQEALSQQSDGHTEEPLIDIAAAHPVEPSPTVVPDPTEHDEVASDTSAVDAPQIDNNAQSTKKTRTIGGLIAAACRVLDDEPAAATQNSVIAAPKQFKSVNQQPSAPQHSTSEGMAQPVVTFYLNAPNKLPYRGYVLLQSLLGLGLRYGKRKIFHRYQNMHANKKIMFSVALSYDPGVFELERMGGQQYQGLAFFMAQELGLYNIIAFEQMLQAIKSLQEELGGDLLDETRQPLTTDKLAQWREQLRAVSSEDDIMPVATAASLATGDMQDRHETR